MKVELRMADPCCDWQAVVRMLASREDLRADVTMIVGDDCLRFVDEKTRPITVLPAGKWVGESIKDLDTMLDLLAWIETEFMVRFAHGRVHCPVPGWRSCGLPAAVAQGDRRGAANRRRERSA